MRLLVIVSYDGSNYAGFQIQPDQITIQSTIESILKEMHKGQLIKITASGRTDAGVHAHGQAFHFDTGLNIPEKNWKRALNALLPKDIVVRSVKQVSDEFHARFSAKAKTYQYVILNQADPDPFQRNYSTHIHQKLNVEAIKKACQHLIGEHDFTTFCAANNYLKGDKIRTIHDVNCEQVDNLITLSFTGNGFLYKMIRIIVGTLIEVGLGRYEPDDLVEMIRGKDRSLAGKTASGHGLYLSHVYYTD